MSPTKHDDPSPEFTDELSDEALDRTSDAFCNTLGCRARKAE